MSITQGIKPMNNQESVKFASYSSFKSSINKDGHTMFTQDIVADLNRRSFLEGKKLELEQEIESLRADLAKEKALALNQIGMKEIIRKDCSQLELDVESLRAQLKTASDLLDLCIEDCYSPSGKFKKKTALAIVKHVNTKSISKGKDCEHK